MDKTVSEEELHANSGQDGKPAYVAYRGQVYDVSSSRLWRGGQHMRRHNAGNDLTADFSAAPHDESVLQRVPLVGSLPAREAPVSEPPALIRWLLEKGPRPHPLAVHFPVAYVAATAVLLLLYLATANDLFEAVAYYVLWLGVAISPVTILLGAMTWWYNYGHKLTRPFQVKISVSAVLLVLGAIALVLRTADPGILVRQEPAGWAYLLLVVLMVLCVAVLGWVGDEITFPRRPSERGLRALLKRVLRPRYLVPVAVLLGVGLLILLLSYEVIGVEFADVMEDQPSAGPQDAPRLLPPADAVPISRPAYLDDPAQLTNPVPADDVSLQRGGVLFSLHCAVCHGAGGQGDGPVTKFWRNDAHPPANLAQIGASLTDGILYQAIGEGIGGMPPLRENMDERERWDVINYVKSLKP